MKKLLVVGGSSGIGKAIVDLHKDDSDVIVMSRSGYDGDNVTNHKLDVLNDTLPDIETIDGLVYCLGSINLKPFNRLKLKDFEHDLNVNLLGAIKVISKYLDSLSKSQKGSVVLFSTVATHIGMPFHASIAAAKGAVEGLCKSLAAEYTNTIRFNCIAPTITDTTLAEKLLRNDKQRDNMILRHPLKKILSPNDVASLAKYLLSNESDAISGQVFPIDAGIVSIKS